MVQLIFVRLVFMMRIVILPNGLRRALNTPLGNTMKRVTFLAEDDVSGQTRTYQSDFCYSKFGGVENKHFKFLRPEQGKIKLWNRVRSWWEPKYWRRVSLVDTNRPLM